MIYIQTLIETALSNLMPAGQALLFGYCFLEPFEFYINKPLLLIPDSKNVLIYSPPL